MSAVMAALPMTGHRASFQMSRRTGSVIKDLSAGRAEAPFLFTGAINTHVQEGEPMKSLLTGIATATALLVAAPVAAQAAGQTCESLTRLCLRPTSCMRVRGYCRWTPVEPAGTCPDYKSSKLDGSGDPWTTGAHDERSAIGSGSLA
jgi:hypothetical protein